MIHSRHRIVVHTINLHFELIINNDVFDDFKRCCRCFSKIVPRLNSIDFLFLSYAWRWNLWIDFEILHYIKISLFDLAAFILFQEPLYGHLIRYDYFVLFWTFFKWFKTKSIIVLNVCHHGPTNFAHYLIYFFK